MSYVAQGHKSPPLLSRTTFKAKLQITQTVLLNGMKIHPLRCNNISYFTNSILLLADFGMSARLNTFSCCLEELILKKESRSEQGTGHLSSLL